VERPPLCSADRVGERGVVRRRGYWTSRVHKHQSRVKLPQKDDSYVMAIDGQINEDPAYSKKLFPIKAELPCVNLSI
jgi:hypothetical protein